MSTMIDAPRLPLANNKKIALWDKVAEQNYTEEFSIQEQQLAEKIHICLQQLGISPQAKLLELGSGSGHLSCLLAQQGYQVSLADFSEVALDKAKNLFVANDQHAHFHLLDIFKADTLGEMFDVTWNSGVMEHFNEEDLQQLFERFTQITSKYYLCIVPNPKSLPYLLFRYKAIRENSWLFGTEFLRENYVEIAEQAGWSLVKQDYLGMEYTIDHMNYFYGEFHPFYAEMVYNGLLPTSEAYLTLYVFKKNSILPNKMAPSNWTEFKTLHFDFIADMQKNNSLLAQQLQKLDLDNSHLQESYAATVEQLNQLMEENNALKQARIHLKLLKLCKQWLFHPLRQLKATSLAIGQSGLRKFPKVKYWLYKIYQNLPRALQKPIKKIVLRVRYSNSYASQSALSADDLTLRWLQQLIHHTDTSRLVICIQPSFFTPDGKVCYNGGAERYLTDLAELFHQHGYEFWILQYAENNSWLHRFKEMMIIGLPSLTEQQRFMDYAHYLINKATLFIASPFLYASYFTDTKTYTIGISHGVYWDRPDFNYHHVATQLQTALSQLNELVSVDTSTINVIRTLEPKLSMSQINYIPNYVDLTFTETQHRLPLSITPEDVVILFPRRLHEARGFYLIINLIKDVFAHHPNAFFVFCGHGDNQELKALQKLAHLYPGRIHHFVLEPEDIYAAYKIADIVLIPTLYSEGTSLSCIEAMASGKALIATCVGGLTDLIIDGYSGLLVKPDHDEILLAIMRLVNDERLRHELGRQAKTQAHYFSKINWQQHWLKLIRKLPKPPQETQLEKTTYTLVHPPTFLVYEVMKQRPQHLFEGLAQLGIPSFYIDAIAHPAPQIINNNLHILDQNAPIDYRNYCVYTYYPYHIDLFTQQKPQVLIYDVLDAPEIHQSQEAMEKHNRMLTRADIVVTSSKYLYKKYKNELSQQEIHYIPNAANPVTLAIQPKAEDFPHYKSKTIGYYGAIAEWFDFELLGKICKQFSECQIVLLGPCREGFPEYDLLCNLKNQYKNLFYLGLKPYEQLGQYAHYFDVSIIPFIENEITKNCSPVKLFEYMSLGKPIVTTEMPECHNYRSAWVAKHHEDFIELLNRALHFPIKKEYFSLMQQEAQENTWIVRAQMIKEALERCYKHHKSV